MIIGSGPDQGAQFTGVNKTVEFEGALTPVYKRILPMQQACEFEPSTMAAVLGLEDHIVESVCADANGMVVYGKNSSIIKMFLFPNNFIFYISFNNFLIDLTNKN